MKKLCFILLILAACEKKQVETTAVTQKPPEKIEEKAKDSAEGWEEWHKYYQEQNPGFDMEKFIPLEKQAIQYREESRNFPESDPEGKMYRQFYIYSPDSTRYIDIDSYHWMMVQGKASFEADQKAVLVNTATNEAKQIAFFGPSYRLEGGYWKNNDEAVLLGSSFEKVPFIIKYDFRNNTQIFSEYPDTLKYDKPFAEVRLENKGIKIN